MMTIEELYAEKEKAQRKQPTSMAGVMKRHQTLARVQADIDYFDQGDLLSKKAIRKELEKITELQQQADDLQREIERRKNDLLQDVFGTAAEQLKK
ncbi:hypothetical protein [Sporosarcina trichiuri]|uniref:hypothetical protein n=1 Tax=Sporosarcina trichiuri TaxID=3056445 RepID=UPI0025B4999A|nr:hypothetical protein [Sporosarcina sp. 0.2-SM1T-5]WJY26252.1 hypothetical protein QWT68_09145 [Sporosarcina sp. 0.2-SM1T-5]